MEIIKYPDKRLREKSADVKLPLSKEDKELASNMMKYIKNPENGAVGLSAIQVGVAKKLCVVRLLGSFHTFINPRIIWHSTDKEMDTEGCLSIPDGDPNLLVPRWHKIRIMAYDVEKHTFTKFEVSGYPARILQHEIDHMNGILYIDYSKEER